MSDQNHAETLIRIGKELAALRVRKGYTSHETFAHDFHLPRVQYWRIERGRTNCTMNSLMKILQIHDMSLEAFFQRLKDSN